MLGCDAPLQNGKEHVIQLSESEQVVLKTCPRKEANAANDFLRVYNWADKGRLSYLYDEDSLPAYMGQAIDMIGGIVAEKQNG